jgi:hypothetical protein
LAPIWLRNGGGLPSIRFESAFKGRPDSEVTLTLSRTAVEAKADNIQMMGQDLGEQYSVLWQEVATIHENWREFIELYGTKRERLDLINQAAGSFFRMVQDSLWDGTLLHLARLTDPPKSVGKENLTIQNFPALINDVNTKKQVGQLVQEAIDKTGFCRDWRNRRISHFDLKLALGQPAVPLADADKAKVDAALKAIVDVMNAVAGSETGYGMLSPPNGAVGLLYVIDDGLRADEQRTERLRNGKPLDGDFKARNL